MENKSSTCHMTSEKRLIDASVLIRDLTAMKSMYDAIALDGIIKALKEAPTVDAVEVVHARWEERYIPNGKYVAWDGSYCSACGNKAAKSHYCHNCGAKMDGGNEDG